MAGAHIEREWRYEQTGMTQLERDKLIVTLKRKGWTQAKIAHRLQMTQPAVCLALQRLAGKPRPPKVRYEMCEGCGRNRPKDQLNADYLCESCAE